MFYKLGLIKKEQLTYIQNLQLKDWTSDFSEQLYKTISNNNVYITNLAKCTQPDARSLRDCVFKAYLGNIQREILLVRPKQIVSFGNQVSSILLGKSIKVSEYVNNHEILEIDGNTFKVFPTYYPVGQGMRNLDLAIKRIQTLIKNN